jgi:ATP synthase protein I
MSEGQPPPSLEDLDTRLKRARKARQPARPAASTRGMAQALRLALEMVTALAVGGLIGWFLDDWLKTGPWLFLVFLLLGVAAGIRNAYRIACQMTAEAGEITAATDRDET